MDKKRISKIIIDKKACIGAATCVVLAPKAFVLNSEGIAELLPDALNQSFEQLVQAAQSCPTAAIKLLDEDGNQI
jgi:ferredoxin